MDARLAPVPVAAAPALAAKEPSSLDLCQASVRFGGVSALTDVSLRVRRGQIYGLIGPNGAGKTTLVNCLSGYQRLTGGTVRIGGVVASGWTPARLRRAGVSRTFQSGRLFGDLTVLENVQAAAAGMGLRGREATTHVHDLLALLELIPLAGKIAATLPYTAARIVSIARALVASPAFVLLDEPAAGMSDSECEQLAGLITTIPTRFDCGVLLIEHNMSVIDAVCHRIHVLDGGCTLADGEPAAIRADPTVAAAYLS